jgi:hypothetical protein
LAWGSSLILMVSSSFPVVGIGVFEVGGVVSLKINLALVWQLESLRF